MDCTKNLDENSSRTTSSQTKILLVDLNPHLLCLLCTGYLIDAATITECLHSFCKSCIVTHLQRSKVCPRCKKVIHETQPLLNVRPDRTLQDIVYKVVANLWENEECRRRKFYQTYGLQIPQKQESSNNSKSLTSKVDSSKLHYYKNDELIAFCLELHRDHVPGQAIRNFSITVLERKHVRCSVRARVIHLKKLLRKQLNIPNFIQIELLCNDDILDEDTPMKKAWLVHWHEVVHPMVLEYRFKES